jgi:hypothetical protein
MIGIVKVHAVKHSAKIDGARDRAEAAPDRNAFPGDGGDGPGPDPADHEKRAGHREFEHAATHV